MNEAEARALLVGAGLALPTRRLLVLLERTEGWPVGLYLAALALKAGGGELRAGCRSGDDRWPTTSVRILARTAVRR